METLKPGMYRHFKGKKYRLLYEATHSETMEPMVVYQALYGERGIWVRPASMWNEMVEHEGKLQRRFAYLGKCVCGEAGYANAYVADFEEETIAALQKKFIALDTETTGMSAEHGKIIELGAILFEEGRPKIRFSTLVHVEDRIPAFITGINHITNEMLTDAPTEQEVYQAFAAFAAEALQGKVFFCAHNAPFDMGFLTAALDRMGISADMKFVDTLQLARNLYREVNGEKQSHKLDDVAGRFGIVNRCAHRAADDALVCGKILMEMLHSKEAKQAGMPVGSMA